MALAQAGRPFELEMTTGFFASPPCLAAAELAAAPSAAELVIHSRRFNILAMAFQSNEPYSEICHLLLELSQALSSGGIDVCGVGLELREADACGIVVADKSPEEFGLQVSGSFVDVVAEFFDSVSQVCFRDGLIIVWHGGSFHFPTFPARKRRNRTIRVQ
jgi:hypothetical protein